MPFTLSHTLVILPFQKHLKKYFSISGLLMGSMVPDFEFFLRITLYANLGHTWWGILFFNLPVSILLLFVFHQNVRNPLIDNLPNYLYQKVHKFRTFNWNYAFKNHFLKIISSILLGILTHFIFDFFTHEPNYIFPYSFDILSTNILLFNKKIKLYDLSQILFSIIGVFYLIYFIFKLPSLPLNSNFKTRNITNYWFLVTILMFYIILLRYLLGVPAEKPFGQIIVITISAFLFSITIVPFLLKKEN